MAQYFNCGFARVAAYKIAKKRSTKPGCIQMRQCDQDELVLHFHKRFQQRKEFAITNANNFIRNLRILIPMFYRRWNPLSAREEYHTQFSEESWKKLTPAAKATHSLIECQGCLHSSPLVQCSFPGTLKRDKENYITASKQQLKRLKNNTPIPLREAKKTALNVLENISEAFEESTGQSFTECLTQNPKTKLQIKPTKQEQKKKRREQLRSYKSSIEEQYKESAVSAVLGTRTSKSQFNKIRMIESFQPQVQTQQSTASTLKSHTPALDNIELRNHNEETLIAEVQSLPSDKLNWSELARKYDVRVINSDNELKNGGQVIKELLRSEGVDVDRFGTTQSVRIRRKRKMGLGGEISIPATSTIAEINSEIKMALTTLVSSLLPNSFQG